MDKYQIVTKLPLFLEKVIKVKTIYSTGAFGEPYRIEVSDDLLFEVRQAQSILNKLPWDGEMFLPVPIYPLGVDKQFNADIVVRKNSVSICIEGPEGRESLLDLFDNLLTIPDIYVSKGFKYDLTEHMFNLTPHDIDMITTWKGLKRKKSENY